ncbi:chemotaxis protein [Wenyingzhuangia sp. chi5]|uniref:Chemotaxis protein n=1 Tax=Wenyingzhuangia gilva TaxID=3057677 RepID=A0ABT8VS68_9FLAO|nr:chemotaxis protein [Wenyingzhuangia sp. chi5]MDO3694794.1 chemotaxis protein [Wenyingzhuangia sp. chi5]
MININKIKKVVSILLVFLIVLTTNLVDKDNFNSLKKSVTTIYEDRIVASDLLFESLLLIHEKETALISSDSLFYQKRNKQTNDEIKNYIEVYDQTKLTSKEHILFNEFKNEFNHLKKLEESYVGSKSVNKSELLKSIDKITNKLQSLSKIQLEEGKQQMFISNKTIKTIDLFTQIEIVFLIMMAILVQFIIFYDPKKK